MSLLVRTLLRNNATILIPTLCLGLGLYLLTDLFERLDNFISAGLSLKLIFLYFAVKIPMVIAQILPVIFLLATVVQLCLMSKSRELMALQAGGISLYTLLLCMLLAGTFWGTMQLGFSEYLGLAGERESSRIWQEEVRKKSLAAAVLQNVWFTEGEFIVSMSILNPDNTGNNLHVYKLSGNGLHIEQIIQAQTYVAKSGNWVLHDVTVYTPKDYSRIQTPAIALPFKQNPAAFRLVSNSSKPQQLSLLQLNSAIKQLTAAGSNVESLRTAWHSKLAYAFSVLILSLVGVAIVSFKDNIYVAVSLALGVTFIYYAIFTLGTTLSSRGLVSPILGVWAANALAFVLASWWMFGRRNV